MCPLGTLFAGDVVGPGLDNGYVKFNDIFYYNTEGHGESFVFEIAYNVYLMRFLKNINQLSQETMEQVLNKVLPSKLLNMPSNLWYKVHQIPKPKCFCLCPIHWRQALSREWRCCGSSADRRCSNYIWVINNFIAY